MSALLLAAATIIAFLIAYRFYSRFLRRYIFDLNPIEKPPSQEYQDGMDYLPTRKSILFGHHFTSIAGATTILGPAIAVIWGWLPAVLWVVLGSIFIGAVHDFGSLYVSLRHQGRSIGDLSDTLLGPRARGLLMLVIFFLLWLLMAIFALVIAVLFTSYPEVVFPVWFELLVAFVLGYLIYKGRSPLFFPTLLGLGALYLSIYLGLQFPISIPPLLMDSSVVTWTVILMLYSYLASVLPIWSLLQPRDYINSWQLYLVMGMALFGLLAGRPSLVAPALNPSPEGAPLIFPFLFVIIASGAISGFHSLVASGTTVRQLKQEEDAREIGYGGMLVDAFLAVIAVLACTAGFSSLGDWQLHYASWEAADPLGAKIGAFVEGIGGLIAWLGIPHQLAVAIGAVLVISLAMTTLDSATRIQRYVINELATSYDIEFLTGRHSATLFAVVTALLLALVDGGAGPGSGGLLLWPLFGTTNQLLAGMVLLVITLYLLKRERPLRYTLLPMLFVLFVAGWAMLVNISYHASTGNMLLAVLGGILFIIELWLILETVVSLRRITSEEMVSARF